MNWALYGHPVFEQWRNVSVCGVGPGVGNTEQFTLSANTRQITAEIRWQVTLTFSLKMLVMF